MFLNQTYGVFCHQLRYMRRHPCRLLASALVIILFSAIFIALGVSNTIKYGKDLPINFESQESPTSVKVSADNDIAINNQNTINANVSFFPSIGYLIGSFLNSDKGKVLIEKLAAIAGTLSGSADFSISFTDSNSFPVNDSKSGFSFTSMSILFMLFSLIVGAFNMLICGILINFFLEDRAKKLKDGFALSGLKSAPYWIGTTIPYFLWGTLLTIFLSVSIAVPFILPADRAVVLFVSLWFGFGSSILASTFIFNVLPDSHRMRKILYLVFHVVCSYLINQIYGAMPHLFSKSFITALTIVFPTLTVSFNAIQIIGGYGRSLNEVVLHNVPTSQTLLLISVGQVLVFSLMLLLWNFHALIFNAMKIKAKTECKVEDHEPEKSLLPDFPREEEPTNGQVILGVDNITKCFKSKNASRPRALDRVSFNIFSNEVFGIIGHNGSGKSTLLSIIAGILKQSSGSFTLNAKNIGFCPQNNILYDALSVKDHLLFMASIRGMKACEAELAIDQISQELNLQSMLNKACKVLSGGEKRRACLAMAFLGNPELVILDEPTSGMDPQTRRNIWSFISGKKHLSSVILCTHYMDEADKLADRKAFLTEGRIECLGSSNYFKKLFKCGYTLTVKYCTSIEGTDVEDLIMDQGLEFRVKKKDQKQLIKEFVIHSSAISGVLESLEKSIANSEKISPIENFNIHENGLEKIFMDQEVFGENVVVGNKDDVAKSANVSSDHQVLKIANEENYHQSRIKEAMSMVDKHEIGSVKNDDFYYKFMRVLKFQFMTVICSWKHFAFKLILALIMVGVVALIRKSLRFDINSDLVNLEDQDVFAEALRGKKFYVDGDCGTRHNSIKFMITDDRNSAMIDSFIKCPKKNVFKVEAVSCGSKKAREVYSSYLIMKLSRSEDFRLNFKVDNRDSDLVTKMMGNMIDSIKVSFVLLASSSVIDGTLKDLLVAVVSEKETIKNLLFSFGVSPWMFQLSTLIRNILYIIPFFGAVYGSLLIADETVFNFSSYFGTFCLSALACSLFVIGLAHIFSDPEKAKTNFTSLSWGAFLATVMALPLLHVLNMNETIQKIPIYIIAFISPNNQPILLKNTLNIQSQMASMPVDTAKFNEILNLMNGALILLVITSTVLLEYRHLFYKTRLGATSAIGENSESGVEIKNINKQIVNNLSMRIEPNEITCLLGVNGAGKTTTMKVIMSQLFPDSGEIQVFGVNAHEQRFKALAMLGYCPQTDGFLIDSMTVMDHLMFFVGFTTADKDAQKGIIMALAEALKFGPYLKMKTGNLSGGTKRKISCAIALLSPSKFVILDEVTTGVDAGARQSLWQGLSGTTSSKAILISTHYMREAGMSDSIAIMKKGQLVCHDSEYGIVKRMGRGYTVTMKSPNIEQVKSWFLTSGAFPQGTGLAIVYENADMITIHLDSDAIQTSHLMKVLETASHTSSNHVDDHAGVNNQQLIQSFSINKVSIEDIFLKISESIN